MKKKEQAEKPENLDKEKLVDEYLDDVVENSAYPETIDKEKAKNENWEKISPEETAKERADFNQNKNGTIAEWEKENRKTWSVYEKDVYDDKGNLIRKKGQRYDAHHIQPLSMGGKNSADNITPISAEKHYDHKGVHANGSPYDNLEKEMKNGGK